MRLIYHVRRIDRPSFYVAEKDGVFVVENPEKSKENETVLEFAKRSPDTMVAVETSAGQWKGALFHDHQCIPFFSDIDPVKNFIGPSSISVESWDTICLEFQDVKKPEQVHTMADGSILAFFPDGYHLWYESKKDFQQSTGCAMYPSCKNKNQVFPCIRRISR